MPPCEAQSKGYPMQAAASPSLAPRPFLMLLGLGAVAGVPRGCITNPSCPELSPPTHLHHASPWAHPRRGGTRTRGRQLHPCLQHPAPSILPCPSAPAGDIHFPSYLEGLFPAQIRLLPGGQKGLPSALLSHESGPAGSWEDSSVGLWLRDTPPWPFCSSRA